MDEALGFHHALQCANDMQLDSIDVDVDFKTTKDTLFWTGRHL